MQAPVDSGHRDDLILEHLPLVKAIASSIRENLPVHVELDELIHAGMLGLLDAAARYDPERKVVFRGYAKYRVRGAILDSLRQWDWASRHLRRSERRVEDARRELSTSLGRVPSEAEVMERLGMGFERWNRVALTVRARKAESSSEAEIPADVELQPDHICARRELSERLERALSTLPARYREVVDLYYGQDLTMKQIGGVLGVNESRVSQIHKSALARTARALEAAGVSSSAVFGFRPAFSPGARRI